MYVFQFSEGGWTENAIARFKELCTVKPYEKLCMHIRNIKMIMEVKSSTRAHFFMVDLFKGDMNIGSKLRKEGHAILLNTARDYYKKVPKSHEARLKEMLEGFKTFKEENEDIDEEFRDEMDLIEWGPDDDFERGAHDNLGELINALKNTTNISEDILLNNVPTTRRRSITSTEDSEGSESGSE